MAYYLRQGLLLVYRGSNGAKNFGNVQNLQFFHKGSPKSYARMGRAEALVARRFSGAVSAMRLKCRMRASSTITKKT